MSQDSKLESTDDRDRTTVESKKAHTVISLLQMLFGDLPLTAWETCWSKMAPSKSVLNTGTAITQGRGTELSRPWFMVWGFHRNKRLVTELKGQAITSGYDGICSHMWFWLSPASVRLQSCLCSFVLSSNFFFVFPVVNTFAFLYEARTFLNPLSSWMCRETEADVLSLKSSWFPSSVLL